MRLVGFRALVALSAVVAVSTAVRSRAETADVAAMLSRIGGQVEQHYSRAQSTVCLETVRLQPLALDLSPDGRHVRRLVYELRVAWEPSPDRARPLEATVLRQILTVDGRPPRPGEEAGCMDPRPVSPEPLAMLLPGRQHEYGFRWAGAGRTDGRASVMLDYKSLASRSAEVKWRGQCVSVELQGRTRGRVWADRASGEVLRLDEHLTGQFEFPVSKEHTRQGGPSSMIIERVDSSIRYQPVTFHDPDETLRLPASIQTLTVIRNAGVPRFRTTQVFSNCKRFLTDARIVREPETR